MKKSIFLSLVLPCFIYFFAAPPLSGKNHIEIGVRIYEGFRTNYFNQSQVITSYNVGSMVNYCNTLKKDISLEKNGLKKVFNLRSIRIISYGNLLLPDRTSEHALLSLSGLDTNFDVVIQLENRYRSLFKIRVKQPSVDTRPLLETELIIPDKRRTAFGFEDKNKRIFYIVFSRQKKLFFPDEPSDSKKIKLVHKILPAYPNQALANRVEGTACFEGFINPQGEITDVKALEGNKLLVASALASLKEWKYNIENPRKGDDPIKISVSFLFELAGSIKRKGINLRYTNFRINYLVPRSVPEESKTRLYNIRPINFQKPVYPETAAKQNREGSAKFRIQVNRNGKIISTEVLGGDPLFIKSCLESIKKWSFIPYLEDGSRFKFRFDVEFIFSLSYE